MKINTESVHFDADSKLLELIERKISKLEQFYNRIIDADVILKLEGADQVRDKVVEVKVNVPGNTFFIKEVDKSFENGLDKSVSGLKRQLIKFKELHRNY